MKRMKRTGFAQKLVYSIFGYYPWRCTKCLGSFMLKKRAQAKRHQFVTNQPETAGATASGSDQS